MTPWTHLQRRASQSGFTLIEVVLAMSIFALMATILYGAFAISHGAVEKSQASFEKNQRLRSFGDLLGSYIRSSYAYRTSAQDLAIYYEGEHDYLSFVSAYSVAMGGRGMAHVQLYWEEGENGRGALTLDEQAPVRLVEGSEEEGLRNVVVLDEGVRELRIAYLDPQSEEENWEERWDAREKRRLPRAVRLTYRTGAGKEVRWVFPIMVSVLGQ